MGPRREAHTDRSISNKTCYWTPRSYRGSDNVWEYYFEPVVKEYSASVVPREVLDIIDRRYPSPFEVGYAVDETVFVSAHYGDHPDVEGKSLVLPYRLEDPGPDLRKTASEIIEHYIRPRDYLQENVERFRARFESEYLIGVHVRGTDSISKEEIRTFRKDSLSLPKYELEIGRLLDQHPRAQIFVATDDESSLMHLRTRFGASRVLAYDSIRHQSGDLAGKGPTGWLMPAYIAQDRERAARNGEEAVTEYLLLSGCDYLVHNGSGLARTALLKNPSMRHTNTHTGATG